MARGPAELVMKLLSDKSVGVQGDKSSWRLGCGAMTDNPNEQIVCVDAPGQAPDPKWLLDYPSVQILVRGDRDGYQAARQKMQDSYDVLLGIDPTTFTEGKIDAITGLSTPSFIGLDTNERPVFSANFRLIYEPATSTLTNREPL